MASLGTDIEDLKNVKHDLDKIKSNIELRSESVGVKRVFFFCLFLCVLPVWEFLAWVDIVRELWYGADKPQGWSPQKCFYSLLVEGMNETSTHFVTGSERFRVDLTGFLANVEKNIYMIVFVEAGALDEATCMCVET